MTIMTIDDKLCKRCGQCIEVCPLAVYVQTSKREAPIPIHDYLCYQCGHCMAICPENAISHAKLAQKSFHPIDADKLPNADQVVEMLRARRSIRAFSKQTVEKEKIETIIQAACLAPSAMNSQTTEFIVIQDKILIHQISMITYQFLAKSLKHMKNKATRTLLSILLGSKIKGVLPFMEEFESFVLSFARGKDRILHNAPVLIIFHAKNNYAYSDINAALALQNASLTCWSLGLGSFISGLVTAAGQNDKELKKRLSIPKDHKIFGALVIGYPKFHYLKWIDRKEPKIKWL